VFVVGGGLKKFEGLKSLIGSGAETLKFRFSSHDNGKNQMTLVDKFIFRPLGAEILPYELSRG
jgi:hypothetical protein